jgi:hypothetical protein
MMSSGLNRYVALGRTLLPKTQLKIKGRPKSEDLAKRVLVFVAVKVMNGHRRENKHLQIPGVLKLNSLANGASGLSSARSCL